MRPWLGSQSIEKLKENIGTYRLIAIDEAQKIPGIGLNLKLIATGSSSFELANQVGEPLVGRNWRTYDQKEIDLVEERDGKLFGFDFTWGDKKKMPALWLETYKNAEYKVINRENYLEFIT